ncbi:MAG: CYTH domain-containing protein [Flavobacterium sp.]
MIEIERKFFVLNTSFIEQASSKKRIAQGYLNTNPDRTVRVRVKDTDGFLTIKGRSNVVGMSRFEWEQKIDLDAAQHLLQLCEPGLIDKFRYEVKVGNHLYEVDVFLGENEGLIIAEIELASEDETFEKPDWLGLEVTGDERYYNAFLSKMPFKSW